MYPDYLKAPQQRPAWLRLDRLLGEHGMGRDTAAGRRQWEAQMEARRGAEDGQKVRIARRLRAETTMTLKWIAGRLHMGTWTHVSNLLSARRGGR